MGEMNPKAGTPSQTKEPGLEGGGRRRCQAQDKHSHSVSGPLHKAILGPTPADSLTWAPLPYSFLLSLANKRH